MDVIISIRISADTNVSMQIYAEVLGPDYNDLPSEVCHGVSLAKQLRKLYNQRLLAFYTRVCHAVVYISFILSLGRRTLQPDDPNYYVQCFREDENNILC